MQLNKFNFLELEVEEATEEEEEIDPGTFNRFEVADVLGEIPKRLEEAKILGHLNYPLDLVMNTQHH